MNYDDTVRYDPKPGIYRAQLEEIIQDADREGHPRIRMKWKILSYPDKESTYYAYRHFLRQHETYLSEVFLDWQGKDLQTLNEEFRQGQASPTERFVGYQADIIVKGHKNKNGEQRCHVAEVYPPGTLIEQLANGKYRRVKKENN